MWMHITFNSGVKLVAELFCVRSNAESGPQYERRAAGGRCCCVGSHHGCWLHGAHLTHR